MSIQDQILAQLQTPANPAGAATSANQASQLTQETTTATQTTTTATQATNLNTAIGTQASATQSDPTVNASLISYARGRLQSLGKIADAAITNSASVGSLIAFIKGIVSLLSGILKVNTGGYTYTILSANGSTNIACKNFHGYYIIAQGAGANVTFSDGANTLTPAISIGGIFPTVPATVVDLAMTSPNLTVVIASGAAPTILVMTN